MSSMPPRPAAGRPPAATLFLEALAAGLPARSGPFPVVVGVSGGADSVALLMGLVQLGFPPGGRLVVAHAHHDLRVEAAVDREFVEALAERLGAASITRQLAVRQGPGGEGLEARARRLRYAFLADAAHECGARQVLVAHTADDQAETILHRALRGTGPAGLAGMRWSRPLADGVSLVRPLLRVSRAVVRPFLEAAGQAWREDASNADTLRARNFLRHEVLPRCVAGPYPAATAALGRLADQAAVTADALAAAAEHILEMHGSRGEHGAVVLRREGLRQLQPHLRSELFATLWRLEGWPRRDMTTTHYRRLAELLATGDHGGIDCPGGVRVTVGPTTMTLMPPASGPSLGDSRSPSGPAPLSPRPARPSRR
jgi:tRNA(Ile)-lysidine synthase